MAKELKTCIVTTGDGKKIAIPGADKVILAVRGPDLKQVQASVDINIPNLNELKKFILRRD